MMIGQKQSCHPLHEKTPQAVKRERERERERDGTCEFRTSFRFSRAICETDQGASIRRGERNRKDAKHLAPFGKQIGRRTEESFKRCLQSRSVAMLIVHLVHLPPPPPRHSFRLSPLE